MFDDILRIFDFLSPSRTREQFQPRKPMAIPLDPTIKSIQICKNLFNDLDEAEAEVVNDIHDPERAWKLLSQIRQLRRETQQDSQHCRLHTELMLDLMFTWKPALFVSLTHKRELSYRFSMAGAIIS